MATALVTMETKQQSGGGGMGTILKKLFEEGVGGHEDLFITDRFPLGYVA